VSAILQLNTRYYRKFRNCYTENAAKIQFDGLCLAHLQIYLHT